MRYADWLRFRADLFMIACFFFVWREAWFLAVFCAFMYALRQVQAMRLVVATVNDNAMRQARRAEDSKGAQ